MRAGIRDTRKSVFTSRLQKSSQARRRLDDSAFFRADVRRLGFHVMPFCLKQCPQMVGATTEAALVRTYEGFSRALQISPHAIRPSNAVSSPGAAALVGTPEASLGASHIAYTLKQPAKLVRALRASSLIGSPQGSLGSFQVSLLRVAKAYVHRARRRPSFIGKAKRRHRCVAITPREQQRSERVCTVFIAVVRRATKRFLCPFAVTARAKKASEVEVAGSKTPLARRRVGAFRLRCTSAALKEATVVQEPFGHTQVCRALIRRLRLGDGISLLK
jgi:hypothetical protein